MYCEKCGFKLEKDAVFCSKCGAKTGIIPSSVQEAKNLAKCVEEQPSVPAAKKKGGLAKGIAVCILGTIGVGVFAAVILLAFMDEKTEDSYMAPEAAEEIQKVQEEEQAEDEKEKVPVFTERAYELTEEQKWLLTEELSSASRYAARVGNDWEVSVDEISDKSILWLAIDLIRRSESSKQFEWITGDSGDWYNTDYIMDADSFLTYLECTFGRTMTRQGIVNYMMGFTLDSGADSFRWSGRTPEDSIGAMIGPVITEARQVSEDLVRISGKYTGGMETVEEAEDTFESEWEIDRASAVCGLRLKSMKVHLVKTASDQISLSWGVKDNLKYVSYAVKGAYYRNPGQGTFTVTDLTEGDVMPLMRDLLLRNNLLGKEIQGDLSTSNFGEAYADFTKEELEFFCKNTLGCEFTDAIRANFEEISGGEYRLSYYAGDYGDVELNYITDGTVTEDGIVEFTGSFRNGGSRMELAVRMHRNEKSCFDGYTLDSVSFY